MAALLLAGGARAGAGPEPATTAQIRAADVIAHLARTIAWYRDVTALQQISDAPADRAAGERVRRSSTRSLQLAFDYARAAAALAGPEESGGAPSPGKNLQQAAARAADRVAAIEASIAQTDAALARAGARARTTLTARRSELVSQLNLAKAIQESIRGLRTFVSGQTSSDTLLGSVERLERSVPEAMRGSDAAAPATAAAPASEAAMRPESAGIFSLATQAIRMNRGQHRIREAVGETDALRKNLEQLRAPLTDALRNTIRRSDAAAGDSASQDARQMEADRREIEALTARFKQLSSVLIPLREQQMLLETTRGSLLEWRDTIAQRTSTAVAYLLIRAVVLFAAILAILGMSELWRRGTFRYVRDAQRRRQFLVVRRIVVTCAIGLAVLLGLVNDFGSVATYAGFLTAGLALALQNVILSVVAYFFLIGRYGLRVGDRVTISGVTGEVLDIGLVRIYVMEMAGSGGDLHATGRVVVFSNSVLFQPAALFKQMPGTDYAWHTVSLTLSPDNDVEGAEARLMAAVDSVYEQYREHIEQQHAAFQRLVDVPVSVPRPQGGLRFTAEGLAFTVRYPVEIRHASAIDDQIMKALRDAISREPPLALAGAGAPKLQETV